MANALQLTAKTGRAGIGETTCSYSAKFDRGLEEFGDLNSVADLFIGREHWIRLVPKSEAEQKRMFGDDPVEYFEVNAHATGFRVTDQHISLTFQFTKGELDLNLFGKYAQRMVVIEMTPGQKIEKPKRGPKRDRNVQVEGDAPVDAAGQQVIDWGQREKQLGRKKNEDLLEILDGLGVKMADPNGAVKSDLVKAILEEEKKSAVEPAAG